MNPPKPTDVITIRASALNNEAFPLRVRFAGGWKDIYGVAVSGCVVTLLGRDSVMVARVYGSSELRVKAGQANG